MSNNRNRNRSRPARPVDTANGAVLHLTTPETDEFAERETLFTIDGTRHTIPKRIPAGAALQYLEIMATRGIDPALLFAMKYALGDHSWRALCAYSALTNDDLTKLFNAVRAKFDGAMSGPKAERRNGSAPSAG